MEFKEKIVQNIEKAADATKEFVTTQQQRFSKILELNKLDKELSKLFEEYGRTCYYDANDDSLQKKEELEENIKSCIERTDELCSSIEELNLEEPVVYCTKCGRKYDITENFCSKCGTELKKI